MKLVIKNILFALFCLCVSLTCCKKGDSYRENKGIVWNTTYRIVYNCDRDLGDSILNALREVEKSVSAFDSTSIVSKINRCEPVEVDAHFRKVYEKSVDVNRISNGAFDPTISPLINALGFGYENQINDTLQIDSLIQFVGIEKSRIEGNQLVKDDERQTFNFSALAKGYGCDQVAEMFLCNGVEDFLIEIGGEIVAHGDNPRRGGWNVAVEVPSADLNRSAQIVVKLYDKSMATSGNYRNYREVGGKRITHTINPKTGLAQPSDVLSATIVADDCMTADAFATACMVMGADSAKMMVSEFGIAAFFILHDGNIWKSEEFNKLELIE